MHSAVAGLGVGAVMFGVAFYKGRTGWHWFGLSLFFFAAIWLTSFVVLYAANVKLPLGTADTELAGFAAAVTVLVVFVLLVSVPYRPRRPAATPPLGAARRDRAP